MLEDRKVGITAEMGNRKVGVRAVMGNTDHFGVCILMRKHSINQFHLEKWNPGSAECPGDVTAWALGLAVHGEDATGCSCLLPLLGDRARGGSHAGDLPRVLLLKTPSQALEW